MFFGKIPVSEAADAILAHGIEVGDVRLPKGHRLTADDAARLDDAGLDVVTAVRLDVDDVHENEAARRLAEAICGEGLSLSAAHTGRCNLVAETRGLLDVDSERLARLNLIDEILTIATLRPYDPVEVKQMVATVKVIPFAVPQRTLDRALAAAADGPHVARVAPFAPLRTALIQTRLPRTRETVLTKTRRVLEGRLHALGGSVVEERRCAHGEDDLAREILALGTGWDLLVIAGASATVDRRDIVPAAIGRAGGEVTHFGMPVDPGNLLLVGRSGRGTILGMPGCARSPKRNGFDWVLQRLAAGFEVGPREIMHMGPGGLLKEIGSRPLPRAAAVEEGDGTAERRPRVAAVLLAAGRSSRMGGPNKLLTEVNGRPMLAWALEAARGSRVESMIVVTGKDRDAVESIVAGFQGTDLDGYDLDLRMVHNPAYADGLSTSLRAGIAAVSDDAEGAVVLLGDMPRVTAEHVDALIDAFAPTEGRAVCLPTHNGKRGNPVLFARRFFAEVQTLRGDVGARALLSQYEDQIVEVPFEDRGVLLDVDTPEALRSLEEDSEST